MKFFGLFVWMFISLITLSAESAPVLDTSGWERNQVNLLDNFGNMYNPCVRVVPDEVYPYRMWFFGWAAADCNPGYPGCDAIFVARSTDLLEWEVYSKNNQWDKTRNASLWVPVITADNKEYDNWHNGDPSVVYKDGMYYMAYSATSNVFEEPRLGHPNQLLLCVRGATSTDGINWTRVSEPILIEPPNMLYPTTNNNWFGDYHRPSLMWDQGKWRLWFDYWWYNSLGVAQGICMGYSENTGDFSTPGGFQVLRTSSNPLIPQWPNPEVVKVGNKYYSYADPPGYPPNQGSPEFWTHRQICEAVSNDGITWQVRGFFIPDPDSPANHVPQASVLTVGDKVWLYLFYAVQRGGTPYDYRYRAIRAMRKPINDLEVYLKIW